jgi:hypothetical protein
MNRKERRAAPVKRARKSGQTDSSAIKHRKPLLSPIEMVNMMRDARPTEVWYFKLKRNAEGKAEHEMGQGATDWAWLDDVDREGYDPRGGTGRLIGG